MKAAEIKEVVRQAIREPRKTPPIFIWGGPGVGKTSLVYETADEENVKKIETPPAVVTDPTDWRGIPMPKDGKAIWLPPSFLPTENERAVMFIDELNVGAVLVQNTLLQLIIPPHRLGDYTLPDKVAIIAAGNREMEAFVHKMSPPLLNRFVHINFDVDLDEWLKWAWKHDIDPRIIAFLSKFRPELLYQFDPAKKAYPTPRSYEFLSMMIKNKEELNLALIQGTIGEGAGTEFYSYLKIWSQLPDLDEILEGKDIIPDEPDLRYAVCVGLTAKAKTAHHFNRLIDFSLKLPRELTIFLMRSLIMKDREKLVKSPKWPEFCRIAVNIEELLV